MGRSIIEASPLLIAASVSAALIYFKVSFSVLQEISAALMVVAFIAVKQFIAAGTDANRGRPRLFLLFFASLFLQILVLSTGGFLSPFIILFHLFTIGLIFLSSFKSALVFLISAVAVLIFGTRFNPAFAALFREDPWSVFLSLLSFVVFVPLYQLIAARYNLTGNISQFLVKHIKLSDVREQRLLSGLSDIILFTDTSLKIKFANQAAEQFLGRSLGWLQDKSLIEALFLMDRDNDRVKSIVASAEKSVREKQPVLITNLPLYASSTVLPRQVNLQIKPIFSGEGEVSQILFILTAAAQKEDNHLVEEALVRYKKVARGLKERLEQAGLTDLMIPLQVLESLTEDLLIVQEMEEKGIRLNQTLVDLLEIIQQVIAERQPAARYFKTAISFNFDPQYLQRFTPDMVNNVPTFPAFLTAQYFTVSSDARWLKIFLEELLDFCLVFGAGQRSSRLSIFLTQDSQKATVAFGIYCPAAGPQDRHKLAEELDRGASLTGGGSAGSGLEGFLVKNISTVMGVPLETDFREKPPEAVIFTSFPKSSLPKLP